MKIFFILLITASAGFSQQLETFNKERLQLDKNLMIGLTSWSLANVAVSGIGWATASGEAKSFHQMNVMWSGVNLTLSIPGYFKARNGNPSSFSFKETWLEQGKTEKVFLFNTALDLTYMAGGLYLKQRALTDLGNYKRFRGWGNSLLMQGGFLFLFDLTAVILHNRHRKNKLDGFLNQVEMSDTGLGFKIRLGNQLKTLPQELVFIN